MLEAWSVWDTLTSSADVATRSWMLEACRQFAVNRASALAERGGVAMKIAIVGSRNFYPMSLVEKFIATLPDDAIVVSGGASGVDSWAEVYAKQRGLQTEIYPAMWSTYGKSAGFRRNADIVNAA